MVPASLWRSLVTYLGALSRRRRQAIIVDSTGLEGFINTRSAHVAQTALYGYLRTRSGTRFPELFTDDRFVESINIAKWQVWLACISDLAVYSGCELRRLTGAPPAAVTRLMESVVARILESNGTPGDAGSDYGPGADRVRSRISMCDWQVTDNEDAAFAQSPAALVKWAPVTDDLKELDEEIVLNSVRFRWHEVKRELRSGLRGDDVLVAFQRNAGTKG